MSSTLTIALRLALVEVGNNICCYIKWWFQRVICTFVTHTSGNNAPYCAHFGIYLDIFLVVEKDKLCKV